MPIRFACARCGKVHVVADRFTGKRGRCRDCGQEFVAPGAGASDSTVFVPASHPVPSSPGKTPWRKWSGSRKVRIGVAVLLGVLVGGLFADTLKGRPDPPVKPGPPVALLPRIAQAVGLADPLTPVQRIVFSHIVKFANDPRSVEVVQWGEPVDVTKTDSHWRLNPWTAVYVAYRTRNEAGAVVVKRHLFYVEEAAGRVAEEYEKTPGNFNWEFERSQLYPDQP